MGVLREIFRAARAANRRGVRAVLATVVKVTGSAYRRPGARMLFPEDGDPVGMVSGGCLEGDLAERARAGTACIEGPHAETEKYDIPASP